MPTAMQQTRALGILAAFIYFCEVTIVCFSGCLTINNDLNPPPPPPPPPR